MNMSQYNRRQIGRFSLAAALSPVLSNFSFAADESGKPPAGKIGDFKISLAQWSLHKRLFADRAKTADLNLDFPKMAKVEFGIDGVEYVNQFFKDKARDEAYLKELTKRAADHGVTNVLIMIDAEGDLSVENTEKRNQAVENHKKWVDAAALIGCHAIRINTGSNYSPTKTAPAAEACAALAEYGAKNKIEIICENHGGPSSDPDSLIALIKAVGSSNFGTLPDFGNFPRDKNGKHTIDIYKAIARMMPYAKGVSAKSLVFDAAGNERDMDFGRILKIVTDAGYNSWIGIEYEGNETPEPAGIVSTKKLLERYRGAEYKG